MKTNLKGLLAAAKTIFSSSCTRFSVLLLSCLLWTSVGWGQFAVTTNGGSGLATSYASLSAAITALNSATISSPVVITCPTGTETAPVGGYNITKSGTSVNTITIQGNGAANSIITAFTPQTSGSKSDAIFKIMGGDYIIIQGFKMQENSSNTVATLASNTMTEWGVGLFAASTTDGAQNNIIQNNTIALSSATAYQNAIGVFSNTASSSTNTAQAAASVAGTNSFNKIYNNTISGVFCGIYFLAPAQTATVFESGNDIGGTSSSTGNIITYGISNTASDLGYTSYSGTTPAGVYFRNVVGNSVRFNTINSQTGLTLTSAGIICANGTAPSGVTYTSNFSDNTITITNTSTTAISGIDFGSGLSTGTIISSNNNITLNSTSTATNSAAIIGIKANYASATNTCNTNTITINQTFSPATALTNSSAITGITLAGAGTTATSSSNTITINQTNSPTAAITSTLSSAPTGLSVGAAYTTANVMSNTILFNRVANMSVAGTSTMSGTVVGISASTAITTLNIGATGTGNTITVKETPSVTGTSTWTSAVTYIDLGSAAHGTANVVANTFNTTGSTIRSTGTLIGVQCNGTVTALYNIKSNNFVVDRVAASGSITFTNQTSSPSNVADTVSNNTITYTNLAGTTTATGISQLGGPSASGVKSFNNNIINISGTHTGTTKAITWGYSAGAKVSNNSITISCAAPTIIAIDGSGTSAGGSGGVNFNTISLTSSTTSPTSMIGINCASTGPYIVRNNTFSALNFTGIITGSPIISGIAISIGTGDTVSNNHITNIAVGAASSTANPTIDGILISGGTSINVYQNKIQGISSLCTGATGIVNGIRISGGTTNQVYNNLIGNLSASASTNTDAIRGISITSSTASSTHKVYNNTIYLSGSGGTNFGGTGLFHTISTTATTSALDLQNNMIFCGLTPNGTGLAVAYRRSAGAASNLANYASTSNKNLFYAGTPGASNLIYSDGTSSAQTMASYQAGVFTAGTIASRDANSFTETSFNPATYFVSTTGSNANFLQPASGLTTQAEGGGNTIAMCSPDYNGVTRPGFSGAAYDVGAWEFAGVSPAPVLTNMVPSPALTSQCTKAARTISIDITTTSGTISGATLNYSHNGTAQTAVTMTNSSGNTWTGTMLAPTTGNATVTWSITATNSLGLTTSYTGTSYSDEPNTGITASASATPSSVCAGSSASLSMSFISSGNVVLGAGASTSSSTSSSFFPGSWGGAKTQYLIRASELTALGLTAGNITAIGFEPTSAGQTYTGFQLWVNSTSASTLTTTFLANGTQVYLATGTNNGFLPVANSVNTLTFGTGSGSASNFNWDGTSNLVLTFSWSSVPSAATSISSTMKVDALSYVCSAYDQSDNVTPSAELATVTADGTGSNRPRFTFTGNQPPTPTAYSWSDGSSIIGTTNPLSTSVTGTPTFTCTATVNGCSMTASVTPTVNPLPTSPVATNSTQCGAGIPTASISDPNSFTTPTFKWYDASTGGSLLQSSTSSTYVSSISTSTTFYVSVSNPTTGCESARTAVIVTVTQPDAISATTSAASICLGQSVTLTAANTASTPTQNYSYSWLCATAGSGATSANTSNPASITPSAAGSFTYTVTGTDGACNVTNTVAVTVNPTTVGGNASASSSSLCQSGSTTISLTGNTGTIQWQSSTDNINFSDISGQTTSSFSTGTISTTTYYRAVVTSGVCPAANSSTATVTVNNPQVLTTSPGSICSTGGSVALSATASSGATLNWYAASTGGTSIGSGTTFNTPSINANTVYYVSAEQIGTILTVGPVDNTFGTTNSNTSTSNYLNFSVSNNTTRIISVDIIPQVASGATFAIAIQNSAGTQIYTTGNLITTVASGQIQTVPIGFDVPVGSAYRILCSTNPGLARNTTGFTFPYTSGNISITGAVNNNYHFFYNWKIIATNEYCLSSRNSVTATVTTPPAITTSASVASICNGASTTLSVSSANSGYTYTWSNSLGSGTSVSASPTTTTTYTVTATDNSGGANNGCTATGTVAITVNPVPSAISLTPSTTQNICAGNIQSIVVSGGNLGSIGNINIGTSSTLNGTTSYPAPYTNYYGGAKHQILIRANELTALGLVNGSQITSVGFNVSGVGSTFTGTLSNFQIDMGHTTSTVLGSTSFISGLTNVFAATTVSIPTSGLPTTKVHTLNTSFTWNGIDNLIIQTSYSNANSGTSTDYVTMTQSDPGFVSTNWYRADATAASSILGATTPTSSGNARPNMVLGVSNQQTITWSPINDLYTDAAATTAYSGTPTTVYAKPTANRTYTATATTSNGCTASTSVTLNYSGTPLATAPANGAYVFGATTNTNYNTAANWYTYSSANGYTIASAVPTSSDVVVIPATSTCVKALPSLSATSSITDVEIQSGAILSLNGNSLSIAGALTGAGTIKGSSTSSLSFTGSASNTLRMDQTTLGTTNVLRNLTLSGTGTITLGNALNITAGASSGSVTAGSGTTLTTGGFLTLKSDVSGTARIAQSAGTISGNVTQERFVPGKAVRKWSFLASPVTQRLDSAWQQQIHITGPGTGGAMCNNYTISGTMTPHSNGFDVTQLQNPSFYTYDAATDNFVANTSGTNTFTLSPGNGYMVLVRGDRNDANNGGCVLLSANNQAAFTSIPVTLAATGTVGQGTITKVLPAGYSFIGNPYPCELDFPSFNTTNSSVISGGYWTYYPTNANYTFSTYNNGTSTNGGTQVIANGQSFLVNSGSGGTITFNEAHKSTTANNGNFRLTKTWDELLRVGLLNNQSNRLDEVVIRFGNDAAITKSINEYDAASVNAGDQWIKTMKDATELAIQTRPNTYQNDTVALAIHAKTAGTYQLGFSEYQGLSNTEVYLIDQQENLIQNVKALPSYDFSVAANTTTANRFKLIFNAKTSGVGSIASNTQLQVYPNPTKDKVSITCNSLEYGAYQVKVRTITGAEVLQAKGFYKNGDVIELSLNDLAAGMYLLELSQDNGFRATQKITKH